MSDSTSQLHIDYTKLNVCETFGAELAYPLIVTVPHAGRVFPNEFLSAVRSTSQALRQNEDLFVDRLILPVAQSGIGVLTMNIGRAFIDVNRDKIELDPKMFADFPADKITIENNRCRFGLGLIHRITADNQEIYDRPLSYAEVQLRIKNVYDVYHRRLQQLVSKCTRKFGFCVVLDCHSMPSKICHIVPDSEPMDFCIGNLFAQSCPPKMSAFLHQSLTAQGYIVTENVPYSGAYTTFNYCRPRQRNYTLQLEINRQVYAHEKTLTVNDRFEKVGADLCQAITAFAQSL